MTTTTRLTGHAAITAAETLGVTLHKHADPTEGARDGLIVAEAREIAREDASLIWCDAPEPTYDIYLLTWHAGDRVESGYRWIFSMGRELASMVVRAYGPGWVSGEPIERDGYATALVLPRGAEHPNATPRYMAYARERTAVRS